MKQQCLIVDDEPLAIKLIRNHISQIPELEVSATANNAIKAFEILNTHKIDVMFLDIKMPNISGLDFLNNINNPPKTIITTAYRDFAIEGFELNVIDYLLKPITFERFFKSVQRITKKQLMPDSKEFIILKSGSITHKISLGEIKYIESVKDYIKIILNDGNTIMSKNKISDVEIELGYFQFLRIHRSFIINKNAVTAFTVNEVFLGDVKIPIGRSYKQQADLFLQNFRNV